jgi:hypothetical protein
MMQGGCTSHSYLELKIAFCTGTLYIVKKPWGLLKFGIMNENIISSTKIPFFSSTLSSNKNYNKRLILDTMHFYRKM